jgi:hypothetical protein
MLIYWAHVIVGCNWILLGGRGSAMGCIDREQCGQLHSNLITSLPLLLAVRSDLAKWKRKFLSGILSEQWWPHLNTLVRLPRWCGHLYSVSKPLQNFCSQLCKVTANSCTPFRKFNAFLQSYPQWGEQGPCIRMVLEMNYCRVSK